MESIKVAIQNGEYPLDDKKIAESCSTREASVSIFAVTVNA